MFILDDLSNSTVKTISRTHKITGVAPTFIKVDLKDPIATSEVFETHKDAAGVIHFAAHKAVGESAQKPLMYYRNNFYSLINTIEAQSEHGINSFIFLQQQRFMARQTPYRLQRKMKHSVRFRLTETQKS